MEKEIERILAISEDSNNLLKKELPLWLHIIEKFLLPSALVFLAVLTYLSSSNTDSSQLELQHLQHEANIKLQKSNNNNNHELKAHEIKVFTNQAIKDREVRLMDLFYKEMSSGDQVRQKVALELLEESSPKIAKVLSSLVKENEESSPNLKAFANIVNKNASELLEDQEALSNLIGYKIGVYYIQKNGTNVLASSIRESLKERGLGDSINLRPRDDLFFNEYGYPQSNEIRYEEGLEDDQADALVSMLNKLYPDNKFVKRKVKNTTKDFISIFLE